MCSYGKYLYLPQGISLEILRGGGRKLKCLKKRMKLKWNFQRGGGQNKRENLSEQDTLFQEEGSYGLVGQPVISV